MQPRRLVAVQSGDFAPRESCVTERQGHFVWREKAAGDLQMSDRTTKLLLAAIALGLWANLVAFLFQPVVALAQKDDANMILSHVNDIEDELEQIQTGSCSNTKICSPTLPTYAK
jgi:hypothetical protein